MIEINLLPKELRIYSGIFRINKEFCILAAGVLAFFLLGFFLMLGAVTGAQGFALTKLEKELKNLETSRRELRDIKTHLRFLQGQISAAEKMLIPAFFWSQKMNDISDLLPPGVWLTQMELEHRRVTGSQGEILSEGSLLMIHGRVYSKEKDEAAIVGKYISALKAKKGFSKDFEDIRLENVQTRGLGQIQAAEFVLACPLKPQERQ